MCVPHADCYTLNDTSALLQHPYLYIPPPLSTFTIMALATPPHTPPQTIHGSSFLGNKSCEKSCIMRLSAHATWQHRVCLAAHMPIACTHLLGAKLHCWKGRATKHALPFVTLHMKAVGNESLQRLLGAHPAQCKCKRFVKFLPDKKILRNTPSRE
jgi:hypothetical protein